MFNLINEVYLIFICSLCNQSIVRLLFKHVPISRSYRAASPINAVINSRFTLSFYTLSGERIFEPITCFLSPRCTHLHCDIATNIQPYIHTCRCTYTYTHAYICTNVFVFYFLFYVPCTVRNNKHTIALYSLAMTVKQQCNIFERSHRTDPIPSDPMRTDPIVVCVNFLYCRLFCLLTFSNA